MPEKILSEPSGLHRLAPLGLPWSRQAGLWEALLRHWRDLCFRLDRDPGLRVSLLDLLALEGPGRGLPVPGFMEEAVYRRWSAGLVRDGVTGLHSEAFLRGNLARETARVSRYGEPASLLILEPRREGGPPDRKTPPTSDSEALLAGLGSRVRAAARESDLQGRFGPSAAALLMAGTDRRGVGRLLRRLADLPVDGAPGSVAVRVRAVVAEVSSRGGDPTRDPSAASDLGIRLSRLDLESGWRGAVFDSAPRRFPPEDPGRGRLRWLAGLLADTGAAAPSTWGRLRRTIGREPGPMAAALFQLVGGLQIDPEDARRHWSAIEEHAAGLQRRLGRIVDCRVAILDYFLGRVGLLHRPVLLPLKACTQRDNWTAVDRLTRCESAESLEVALVREQRRARRRGVPFCLVRLDADRFGDWNRRYGVEAGDRLLCAAGSRLARSLRRSDLIARTGGDDFFLLLPHADPGGGERAAERVRRLLGAGFEGCPPGPTWSAGVAGFRADAAGRAGVVAAAAAAVEQAKRSGGDRVTANSPSHRYRIDV